MTTTYAIPLENLGAFATKMKAMRARADKLGLEPPTYTTKGHGVEEKFTPYGNVTVEVAYIEVEGKAPRFDGWVATAVIDMEDHPHLVHTFGDFQADALLHLVPNHCDHCGFVRNRKKLVQVQHEDGTRKIVGSTCLGDFVGHTSPQALAAWMSELSELDGFCGGLADDLSKVEAQADPKRTLALVSAIIRVIGWKSKGQAKEESSLSTADAVEDFSGGRNAPTPETLRKRWGVSSIDVTDDDMLAAEAALAWAQSIDLASETSDYLRNLRIVAGRDVWRQKDMGLGISMVSAHQRHLAHLAEKAREAAATAKSEWVGTPKVREHFDRLTVDRVRYFDGDYGLRILVSMHDDDDNVIVWWATRSADWIVDGMVLAGKCTVKEHSTYNGTKQTLVQRCTLEEVS